MGPQHRTTPEAHLVADLIGVCSVAEALRLVDVDQLGQLVAGHGLEKGRHLTGRNLTGYSRLAELAGQLVVVGAHSTDLVADLCAAVGRSLAEVAWGAR